MEMPEEISKVAGPNPKSKAIRVRYRNWKGETAVRSIIPLGVFYGSSEFHKEEQWLLKVWDLEKSDYRTYALKGISEWLW